MMMLMFVELVVEDGGDGGGDGDGGGGDRGDGLQGRF